MCLMKDIQHNPCQKEKNQENSPQTLTFPHIYIHIHKLYNNEGSRRSKIFSYDQESL